MSAYLTLGKLMFASPKFSIVMNCRNSARYLRQAIESVRNQTELNWEIIFLDNDSTDESAGIAHSYRDSRIKYFKNSPAVSLGEARNLALNEATGEYISFLDCDDIWLPNLLEKQLEIFESDKSVSFLHTNYFTLHEPGGREILVNSRANDKKRDELAKQLAHYQIGILTASIRRSVLLAQKEWFDPQLTLAEDVDLFLRLIAAGGGRYIDEPLAKYRIHGNNLSAQLKKHWAHELETCLAKLLAQFPQINERYDAEISKFEVKIAYLKARDCIANGDTRSARRELKPHKFASLVMLICYLLTFFPHLIWSGLYRAYFYLRYR